MVLAGLAAVGVPPLIHLLNKMRVRHVRWAAMRFLHEAVNKNQRKLKLENLILLALRCLLVALLVAAFARPVLNPDGLDARFDGAARTSVILLDESASMSQSDGARTRMDLAKEVAAKYLDALGPGSRVDFVPVMSPSPRISSSPGAEVNAVRKSVGSARPAAGANNWPKAIAAALDALNPLAGTAREIVIITDNQATGWTGGSDLRSRIAASPDVKIQVVPVGRQGEDNLGVVSLRPESPVAAARQPFACLVEIANHGTREAENVRVTLAVDGNPPSDEKLIPRIAAGGGEVVRLSARFEGPGFHAVTAAIGPDRLPADDSRSMAFDVVKDFGVAIVEDSPSVRARDRAGFFLSNALVPVTAEKQADYYLQVRSHPPAWLESAPLEADRAIMLADPGRISSRAAERLRRYVENGGALVIFPGPQTDPAALNADLAGVLPAMLGPVRETGDAPLAWQADGYAHPITAYWNASQGDSLGTVSARRFFPLAPGSEEGVRTIVSYADGTPAAVERPLGKGRVVLFSSTADTRWTNLPIHPNFVPLLRRLIGYAAPAQGADRLLVEAGEPFQMRVGEKDVGRSVLVRMPGETTARAAGRVAASDGGGEIAIRDTAAPGAYFVFYEGSDVPVAAFAVQVPAEESELRVVGSDPLGGTSDAAAAPRTRPVGEKLRRELWGFLLLLALLVGIVEMGLAHRFSLAK